MNAHAATTRHRILRKQTGRAFPVYEQPGCARDILAKALGITPDEAQNGLVALVEGGFGIAPINPTNGMLVGYLEALTPPIGHEQVVTAIGKARVRWKAMLTHGIERSLSRKVFDATGKLVSRDSDGTATAAANGDLPVPKDCQARAEGIAQTASQDPSHDR